MINKEVFAKYTYELPLPNDEEIRSLFESIGVSDVNPEMVRTYIRQCIYDVLCNAINKDAYVNPEMIRTHIRQCICRVFKK